MKYFVFAREHYLEISPGAVAAATAKSFLLKSSRGATRNEKRNSRNFEKMNKQLKPFSIGGDLKIY
jgi:hypothetical protein